MTIQPQRAGDECLGKQAGVTMDARNEGARLRHVVHSFSRWLGRYSVHFNFLPARACFPSLLSMVIMLNSPVLSHETRVLLNIPLPI